MMNFSKMSFLSVIGVLLALVKYSEATSEMSAIVALSIFITIPALFLLTCCTALICVCHYRNKIPIFKSFVGKAKTGAGIHGKSYGSSAPPPNAPGAPMPPPAAPGIAAPGIPSAPPSNPDPPPGEKPPGSYEMKVPVEIDEVVIPIKKE
ncbi:protein shisa-4 [Strongylocentrotus purpuratus]|uniref:Uncharacterized protein n=1 Tax=Strongylocentrotus purpuratus TaxID=7668 RepID=A0A7M7N6T7_STRPU|nr:protein shisa-4 [Strongylocentrotus purpuratus]|eukprot:XP_799863.2 PREDICTED: protein shisa-4-like [Strongylocentrotus purpuratus]